MKQATEANAAELRALTTAFQIHANNPPSGSAPLPLPTLKPTSNTLLTILEPRIVDAVRADITPLLTAFRTDVDQLLKKQTDEMLATVWDKIQKVIVLSEEVNKWIQTMKTTGLGGTDVRMGPG